MAGRSPKRPCCGASAPLVLLAAIGCGCPAGSGSPDDGSACSFDACEEECRPQGLCYGSCSGGTCHCAPCPSADADADGGDGHFDDGRESTDADGRDDSGDADGLGDGDTRPGGSPGVVCRKVPAPDRDISFWPADGAGSSVLFVHGIRPATGREDRVLLFDWLTGATGVLDDLSDISFAGGTARIAKFPTVSDGWAAYGIGWVPTIGRLAAQLRLLNLATREKRVLDEGSAPSGETASIVLARFDYPWVVWKRVSEETTYGWNGYALNIETDQRIDLPGGVVDLDLLGSIAIVSASTTVFEVDLVAGTTRDLLEPGPPEQWAGVITPDWIAWLDQRAYPDGSWFSPYGTQVYGLNRHTGEDVPLVASPAMHGRELDAEGDWLVYTDQRDDADPWRGERPTQNIYALHLPTMTEICVENWPGYQMSIRAYAGVAETHVLFVEEINYADALYDLWDCNLPTPTGGDGDGDGGDAGDAGD